MLTREELEREALLANAALRLGEWFQLPVGTYVRSGRRPGLAVVIGYSSPPEEVRVAWFAGVVGGDYGWLGPEDNLQVVLLPPDGGRYEDWTRVPIRSWNAGGGGR